jgi:hypothetical protein
MKIIKSPNASKKYRAIFDNGKHTDFGASGYSDYISSKDEAKKKAYIARHKVNENWSDPYTAGTLSRYILWNLPTLQDSINDYKKRFSL